MGPLPTPAFWAQLRRTFQNARKPSAAGPLSAAPACLTFGLIRGGSGSEERGSQHSPGWDVHAWTRHTLSWGLAPTPTLEGLFCETGVTGTVVYQAGPCHRGLCSVRRLGRAAGSSAGCGHSIQGPRALVRRWGHSRESPAPALRETAVRNGAVCSETGRMEQCPGWRWGKKADDHLTPERWESLLRGDGIYAES